MAGATYFLTGTHTRVLVKREGGRVHELADGAWVETDRYLGTGATPIPARSAERFIATRTRAASSQLPPSPQHEAPARASGGLVLYGAAARRMLAFAAASRRGEFGAELQELGEEILSFVEADAERRDLQRARRGQLALPNVLAGRCYPTLPRWRLRRPSPTTRNGSELLAS
ncbi:hypothetical protein [Anaeromyxobacter soli]|uniref:hypothetical protein n=1 Tax=Anaeromyxobacter soli TaxID=2922725 RepID=UPI001FAED32E|nr:hypothetical protein [Anaeromyxobacter sp. SG29]